MKIDAEVTSLFIRAFPTFKNIVDKNCFAIVHFEYGYLSFGNFNFLIQYKKIYFSITNDRGQYFLRFSDDQINWIGFDLIMKYIDPMYTIQEEYTLEIINKYGAVLTEEILMKISEIYKSKSRLKKLMKYVEENRLV